MKRFLAIATLVLMLVNYTGFEFCIDYCCDQIESIHLGASHDPCHDNSCHAGVKGSCCDTDEVRLEQQLLEFTKVTVPVMEPIPMPLEFISVFTGILPEAPPNLFPHYANMF